jgi:ribosomal protein S18 acetylase RimI-like enzyme
MIISFNKSWTSHLKNIDIKSYYWPWDDEYWLSDQLNKSVIKMWVEPTPLPPFGFIAYRFINVKDIIKTGEIQGTVIHISKLAVHPNHRNKGIGTKLLENIEATAKLQSVNVLTVILYEENNDGIKWLLKRGFKGHGLHPEVFPDGRDGYSFCKVLE